MVSSAVQVRVETPGCGLHQNKVWAVVETSERVINIRQSDFCGSVRAEGHRTTLSGRFVWKITRLEALQSLGSRGMCDEGYSR